MLELVTVLIVEGSVARVTHSTDFSLLHFMTQLKKQTKKRKQPAFFPKQKNKKRGGAVKELTRCHLET